MDESQRARLFRWAVLGVVAATIAIYFVRTRSEPVALETIVPQLGCGPIMHYIDAGNDHVVSPEKVTYSSNPPTTGPHYATPAPTGVHTKPIQNEIQVQNLEQGHIGIQYRDGVPAAVLDALAESATLNARWVFMAPKRDMRHDLALSAWATYVPCDHVAAAPERYQELVRSFFARHGDRSPYGSKPGSPLS